MARLFVELRDDTLDERDLARRVIDLLDDGRSGQGECAPPVDVVEHGDRLEIVVDVPGIPAESIRVIYARGTLVIAGRKLPRACSQPAAFHLAERRFGRFVRAVALSDEFDAGRAAASLSAGELRIVLPRVADRRGGEIDIEIIGR